MDLSDPTQAVTPTLDGPILAVLATAGRPLTVGEVASQAVRGSEIGIRRTMARLVDQGIVRATQVGRNRVHELNRDHLAAGIADLMAGLRLELWRRLRAELASWTQPPLYAAVFGSAARGDGDVTSDIDLLLVQPPLQDDDPLVSLGFPIEDSDLWHVQIDNLRDQVQRWTGNPTQVVNLALREWLDPTPSVRRLRADVARDGVEVARTDRLSGEFWDFGG